MTKVIRQNYWQILLMGITFSCWSNQALAQNQPKGSFQYENLIFEKMPSWFFEKPAQQALRQAYSRVESFMEWSLRKTRITYYDNNLDFARLHNYGSTVVALSFKTKNTIHLGPKVNAENFAGVMGHEMVHIAIGQKYKESIPQWLEEGLANYVSGRATVNYKDLAQRDLPRVKEMGHPFKSTDAQLHYYVSTALMEMLGKKCDFNQLLQMSVGKKLDQYLSGVCGFNDLDLELKKWIKAKSPK